MLLQTPPRTRRRRRGLVLLGFVLAVIAVAIIIGNVRSERSRLAGYLDVASIVTDVQSGAADQFVSLATRFPDLERPTLVTTLEDIHLDLTESQRLLEESDPPGPAARADASLRAAGRSWIQGLEQTEQALLWLVDLPDDPEGLALLDQGLLDMRAGDVSYEEFLTAATELEDEIKVPDYPMVRFVPAEVTTDALAAAARGAGDLVVARDLAVEAVRLDPRILAEREDGVGIVPLTEELAVSVTVSNPGNARETDIPVQVRVAPAGGGPGFAEDVIVGELAPGASTSVDYVVAVVPGFQYEITVSVGNVAGDVDELNNFVRLPIVINEEQPSA